MREAQTSSGPPMGRILLGGACLSLQPLVLNIVSVPALAYIIHQLGPEGYAQWMVATTLLGVCAAVTSLGLRGAFVRRVAADPGCSADALAEQLGVRVLLAALGGAIVVCTCRLMGYSPAVVWCTLIGSIAMVFTAVSSTLSDLLQAHHRLKTIAGVNFLAGLALTIASVAAAWSETGPAAVATAYLVGPALGAVLALRAVRARICGVSVRWDLRRSGRLLAESRFFAAQQLLVAGSTQAEALMLPRLVGMNRFGYFSAGTLLATRLTALPDGLCTAAYPSMVKACRHDARGGGRMVVFYGALALVLGVALAAACTVAAEPIGRLLFPSRPEIFGKVARITIWALPLAGIELVLGYALNAAGKDREQARASVPAACACLAISVGLVTTLGVTGACIAMVLRPAVRTAFLAPIAAWTFRSTAGGKASGAYAIRGDAVGTATLRKAG